MILVLNSGSSSLKAKLFDQNFNEIQGFAFSFSENSEVTNQKDAIDRIFNSIDRNAISKIGVRVVHGGNLSEPCEISDTIRERIKLNARLAPLHNPPALELLDILPDYTDAKIYAVFDTAFFSKLPKEASIYALPLDLMESHNIRKYGFHGISHSSVKDQFDPNNEKRLISVHLGAGSSISAIKEGQPIDTSMGMTPDDGLVMQTRSGDLDPGIVMFLMQEYGLDRTKTFIEEKSGLAGLTGTSGEMMLVLALAGYPVVDDNFSVDLSQYSDKQKENSRKAMDVYVYRIKKYIGAYAALMGGVDILAFTGKIGANSEFLRDMIVKDLGWMNIGEIVHFEPNEELAIAKEVSSL